MLILDQSEEIFTDLLSTHLRAGETNQVGTETESSALASSDANGRRHQVQHSKDYSSDEGEGGDFVDGESLAGDKDSSTRYNQTFDQIFDSAIDNFSNVHLFLYSRKRKFFDAYLKF
jgi:hypothetical protein